MESDLIKRFENRILSVDFKTVSHWGKISGRNEKKGIKSPVIDSLIASTAIINNLALVTRNINDFKYLKCKTFNPWE